MINYKIKVVNANYGIGIVSIFYGLEGKMYLVQEKFTGFWSILGWKDCRISKYSYAKFYTIKEATDFINSKPNI